MSTFLLGDAMQMYFNPTRIVYSPLKYRIHNTYFEETFWPQITNNIIYLCVYYGAIRRHFGKQINKQTNEQRNE